MNQTNFRLLLDLFKDRFLENDAISSTGFETNVAQVLGILAQPGFFAAIFLLPAIIDLSTRAPGPNVAWLIRTERLFFPTLSFTVTGFATLFEWDVLFPDRRDFQILAPLPLGLPELFGAKFAALGLFLLSLTIAVNFFPIVLLPVFSILSWKISMVSLIRITTAQIVSSAAASLFAFFAVGALQGILINVTSPRAFRRVSPAVQIAGMSLMVLSLFTFPIYSMLLREGARTNLEYLSAMPWVWFAALYDLLLPDGDPAFAALGIFGLKALALAVAVFLTTWFAGCGRHYRRLLESEESGALLRGRSFPGRLIRLPEERAICEFACRTMARSTKHRLLLATYLSAGFSFGLLTTLVVQKGGIGISDDGLRAFPFLLSFFVVTGCRAVFQVPAELPANWLFRITESRWTETARAATRKCVLAGSSLAALFTLPVETFASGWARGLLHFFFQITMMAILIEVFFWMFDKVPFTCSWFPGRLNLGVLCGAYLYGFTTYSSRMADMERMLDTDFRRAALFFVAAATVLTLSWRYRRMAEEVSFDAAEPEVRILDLT